MKSNNTGVPRTAAWWIAKDPELDQQARQYEFPIPSRTFLLDYLGQQDGPLTRDDLQEALDLQHEDEHEALRRRLIAMCRDGQLVQNRRGAFGLAERMDLLRGKVLAHPDGFGFIKPEDGGDDLFMPPNQMRSLMHGDQVLVQSSGTDHRGRRIARLTRVLKRNTQTLVGRLITEGGVYLVIPDDRRINHDVMVPEADLKKAEPGQIVEVEIVEQPSRHAQPLGRIAEVLGDHLAPGMEIDIAIRAHDIPHRWPAGVEAEAKRWGKRVSFRAKRQREDLRKLPLVTIDGADAKDFDDAVYAEESDVGWRLIVAIADVSHYVTPGSLLDQEAQVRGNSVYFPERVIPMLPETLSNGLCSINPKVDRLCMVCDMQVDMAGEVQSADFYEAVMRSHARLTYDAVAKALDADEPPKRLRKIMPQLYTLHDLFLALFDARQERGAMDFDSQETRIVFGTDQKIEEIVPVERNDAHRLIEECMIAANVEAAKFLHKAKMPALYRSHIGPPEDRLQDLRQFLGEFGLQLRGGDSPTGKDYYEVMDQLGDRPERRLIQTVMLRSMSQAVYSNSNDGHFGLAHKAYTHFTSPIRRYPDLLVHRAIKQVISGEGAEHFEYDQAAMEAFGVQTSATERRADEATRDVTAWLKCEYMQAHVGDSFTGSITGVAAFGLFVEIDNIYCEGMVHVSSLNNDYYHYDATRRSLNGERTGKTFRLADKLEVQVMRVDLDERKIDLQLVEPEPVNKRRKGRTRKPRSKKS